MGVCLLFIQHVHTFLENMWISTPVQGESNLGHTAKAMYNLGIRFCAYLFNSNQLQTQSGNIFDQATRPWRLYKR